MSSTGWDVKHLKVPFGMCRRHEEKAEEEKKKKEKSQPGLVGCKTRQVPVAENEHP